MSLHTYSFQIVNIFLFFICLLNVGCETLSKRADSTDLRKVSANNACREIQLNVSDMNLTVHMFNNIDDGFIYNVSLNDAEGNDETPLEIMSGKLFYKKFLLGLRKEVINEQSWNIFPGIEKTHSILIKGTRSVAQINVLDCNKRLIGIVLKRTEYTAEGKNIIYQLLYGDSFNNPYASSNNAVQNNSIIFTVLTSYMSRDYGYNQPLLRLNKVETDVEGLYETWKISPEMSTIYSSSREKSDILILAINAAIWIATEHLKRQKQLLK